MEIKKLSATQNAITEQIAEALTKLGAKSDLVSMISSWGDTLPEEDVLEGLRKWNSNNPLPRQ